jgi:hypothetical protein
MNETMNESIDLASLIKTIQMEAGYQSNLRSRELLADLVSRGLVSDTGTVGSRAEWLEFEIFCDCTARYAARR